MSDASGSNLLKTMMIGVNEFKIGLNSVCQPFPVVLASIAHYLCRRACDNLSGGDRGLLSDKGLLGYDGTLANGGKFTDHGLHSNEGFIVDSGVVDHRQVSNNYLITDFGPFGSVDNDALFDQ